MSMPEKAYFAARPKRSWWRMLLGVIAAVALILLIVNPELAAMGFLFDPVLLDVALVFFGTQLMFFNGQVRLFFSAAGSSIVRRLKASTLRR